MSIAARLAEALAHLRAEAFGAGDQRWSADDIATLAAARGGAVVTDRPEAPRAFAVLRVCADEAEILTIAVHPRYQGHGMGATVLAAAERTAHRNGAVTMFLEVATRNTRARALYARAGYAEAGRRPGYYARSDRPSDDALVLRKDLRSSHDPTQSASSRA